MPLKLNVGLYKTVGLPNYSSLEASCHVEVELDSQMLIENPRGLQDRVRDAFMACNEAVETELSSHARDSEKRTADTGNGHSGMATGNGLQSGSATADRTSSRRPATAAQVRALQAIANRRQ